LRRPRNDAVEATLFADAFGLPLNGFGVISARPHGTRFVF
jgi:hypothetical protein